MFIVNIYTNNSNCRFSHKICRTNRETYQSDNWV